MHAIALQVRTSCGRCGSPLPLNAMVPRLACPACGAENEFGEAFWTAVLGDSSLRTCTLITQGRTVSLEVQRRDDPACATCGEAIATRRALDAADDGSVACERCAGRTRVRVPPPAFVLSGFRLLVGEDEMQLPAAGATVPAPRAAARPIAFHCPTCGGVLQVDGAARVVACGYCGGAAYLPDDLWHVFHPVPVSRTWYLLHGRGLRKRTRREARDPAATPERLDELSRHLDHEVRAAVARHPRAAEATLRRMVEADDSLATEVLDNPALPPAMWAFVARMGRSWTLRKIAASPHAPPDVLRTVAAQVAHRLSDEWAGDDDEFDASDVGDVLGSLAENPASPAEVLAEVAELNADRAPSDRGDYDEALARHPHAPPALLAALAGSEDDSAREAVAAHPRTPVEVLEALAGDAEWSVREAVARRPEVSPETLKRLGGDADSDVREAARGNPSYPRFRLWKALFGG